MEGGPPSAVPMHRYDSKVFWESGLILMSMLVFLKRDREKLGLTLRKNEVFLTSYYRTCCSSPSSSPYTFHTSVFIISFIIITIIIIIIVINKL